MSVSTSLFLERMEARQKGFGNVVTAPLRLAWSQLCTAFNDKLRAVGDPSEDETWKVLCPPTGSGKTQGLIVYASLLNAGPMFLHPGVIIVTRRIDDANKIASQINELSRECKGNPELPDMAISYHSEKKGLVGMDDLSGYPVLVICHKAYTVALDMLNRNAGIEDTWEYFYSFSGGKRKLVIIDEAIDLVEFSEIQKQDIDSLLFFSGPIKNSFPFERSLLKTLSGIFEEIEQKTEQKHHEMILSDRPVWQWQAMIDNDLIDECCRADFTEFKKALRSVRMDGLISKNDPAENRRLRSRCIETVSAVDSLFKAFIFYSRTSSSPTFNTSRFLVPPNINGGVILDATASCNVVYDLFNGTSVIQPPPGTRVYRNVRLHASYGHQVGQSEMKKDALTLSQSLVSCLDGEFSGEEVKRKVLIVTHKKVKPLLLQCVPKNFTLEVAHWGAIDGSNNWNTFDTVVIFGLPYKPKRWAASVFMGYQGVQDTMWLHDASRRRFKEHEDIRKSIETSQMVTDIIQAINRVQCRRVIDDEGNCPETFVFILLPTPKEAESLLEGITKEMPGIVVTGWNYSHQKQGRRGRKSTGRGNWDESLVAYLETLKAGDRVSASSVKKALAVKVDAWKDVVTRIKTHETYLFTELQRLEVTYQPLKQGAFFLKSST